MSTPVLTVYSTNNCAYCSRLKQDIKNAGLEFIEINLDKNPEIKSQLVSAGHRSVPILYKDQTHIATGYDNSLAYIKTWQK
jgi:glutaredoxin